VTFSVPEEEGNIERKAFNDTDNIRSNTKAALKVISQNQFQNCFEGWTRRGHRCIASQWSTLKATTVIFAHSTFNAMSSRTLLSGHVLKLRCTDKLQTSSRGYFSYQSH
jgi:hypothetical protein